jgi:GT2 family glycosyltransferase
MMQSTGLPGKLIDVTHGGPVFGSIINTARFGQLAGVYNKIWQHIPEDAEVVVFMEGDLIWDPTVLVELINRLQQYPAVSPMIFTESTRKKYRHFYDIWAYAVGGVDFKNKYPYHSNVNGKPVALDSCGSCVVMRAEAARQVHFPADDMVRGMTRLLAKNGSPVWLQPDLAIEHPK